VDHDPAATWLRLRPPLQLYSTDAVKVFVPEHRGKRADQLDTTDIDRHAGQWRDERIALREHGAVPHLILVFGAPFWETACQTFHPERETAAGLGVRAMKAADGGLRGSERSAPPEPILAGSTGGFLVPPERLAGPGRKLRSPSPKLHHPSSTFHWWSPRHHWPAPKLLRPNPASFRRNPKLQDRSRQL